MEAELSNIGHGFFDLLTHYVCLIRQVKVRSKHVVQSHLAKNVFIKTNDSMVCYQKYTSENKQD